VASFVGFKSEITVKLAVCNNKGSIEIANEESNASIVLAGIVREGYTPGAPSRWNQSELLKVLAPTRIPAIMWLARR
jgi:hypothetical protein